jgi:ATP-dependent DNA helicase RecG
MSMTERVSLFSTKLEHLKGVGPQRADLLQTELGLFTVGDLLQYYPFRYEDRTQFHAIRDLHDGLAARGLKNDSSATSATAPARSIWCGSSRCRA